MTNEELMDLRELHDKAKPFSNNDGLIDPLNPTEQEKTRIENNILFFTEIYNKLPVIIDELLRRRAEEVDNDF